MPANRKELTLAEIASLTSATLVGDAAYRIEGVAALEEAAAHEASFVQPQSYGASAKGYVQAMERSRAGVLFVEPSVKQREGQNYLVHEHPSRAFQDLVEHFHPPIESAFTGVHATAIVHPSARLGQGVQIGPYAVVDQGVRIGDRSVIGPHASIGPGTVIGSDCQIHAQVTLREACELGDRVVLQPGAVIGSCGFGYTQDEQGRSTKLNQVGNVILEDDVEIGANTAIDRGRFSTTRIRRGSKIDNLCQIAHGVEIGEDNLIAGQTGIAGSSKTGRRVVLGGQVAVKDHVELADGVTVGGRSGVMGSLKKAGPYVDTPARPYADAKRKFLALARLERAFARIEALEQALAKLTS